MGKWVGNYKNHSQEKNVKMNSCRRTAKPLLEEDSSFSRDEIAIKRTNVTDLWEDETLQTNWKSKMQVVQAKKKQEESLNMRHFQR